MFYSFLLFLFILFIPLSLKADNLQPTLATKNATVVYSTITGKPLMLIIDANELNDAAFNPPNSIQVRIPPTTYNAMTTSTLRTFLLQNAPVVSVIR
jgi:hypothetical protein